MSPPRPRTPLSAAPRSLAALLLSALALGGCDDLTGTDDAGLEFFEVVGEGFLPQLNDAGDVAFTRRGPGDMPRPMIYRDGEVAPLPLAGDSGCVVDLNDRGDVLGYDPRPVVWRADGTTVGVQAGGSEVRVDDLTDGGVVVGGIRGADDELSPARWSTPDAEPEELPLSSFGGSTFQCGTFDPGFRPSVAANDRGRVVSGHDLLHPDGGVEMFGVIASDQPTLFQIDEEDRILGTFIVAGRGGGTVKIGLFEGGDVLRNEFFRLIPHLNDVGDVAHTMMFDATRREHRLYRDAAGPDPVTIRIDTLPEFEDQELHQLQITDVNDLGAVVVQGFRPDPGSPAMIAVYRHPALER